MKLYKSDKVRFISGLIIIILIYSWFYIFFIENSNLVISKLGKYFVSFATTIAVYFVGTFHLGKLKDKWMSLLWHVIHVSGLCIATSLGLVDWLITDIGMNLVSFARSIQEMLISPLLYLAMGLINRVLNKDAVTDTNTHNKL